VCVCVACVCVCVACVCVLRVCVLRVCGVSMLCGVYVCVCPLYHYIYMNFSHVLKRAILNYTQ